MAKTELKTRPRHQNTLQLINQIKDPIKQSNSLELLEIFENITGKSGVTRSSSMISFGNYHYKYESKQEGNYFRAGFLT